MSQHSSPDITTEVWYSITKLSDSLVYFQDPFLLCLNELLHSSNGRNESENFDLFFFFNSQ